MSSDPKESVRRAMESLAEQGVLAARGVRVINERRENAILAAVATGRRSDHLPRPLVISEAMLEEERQQEATQEEPATESTSPAVPALLRPRLVNGAATTREITVYSRGAMRTETMTVSGGEDFDESFDAGAMARAVRARANGEPEPAPRPARLTGLVPGNGVDPDETTFDAEAIARAARERS